jgi:hypothetical protein
MPPLNYKLTVSTAQLSDYVVEVGIANFFFESANRYSANFLGMMVR